MAVKGNTEYDIAVLGGGVLGCTAALHLARAGMRVAVLESRGGLCTQASGVNTGAIGVMSGRPYRVPYALRSMELWQGARTWLGADVGYQVQTGLKLAFTDAEAAQLEESVRAMRVEGGALEMVGPNRARELEPAASGPVRAAALSPRDGYANPLLIARAFRGALAAAGVDVHLNARVSRIDTGPTYAVHHGQPGPLLARQVLLAAGVWIGELAGLVGVSLPVLCRVSQVTVTERLAPLLRHGISTASGMLSLKQVANGTVLIGGGWQGLGNPADGPLEVVPENLIGNLRLACAAVPALAQARAVRTWLGLEARVADNLPLAGPLPGHPGAWVLGAIHTGFALSPIFGLLMAQQILGRTPDLPLFDPARATAPVPPDRPG